MFATQSDGKLIFLFYEAQQKQNKAGIKIPVHGIRISDPNDILCDQATYAIGKRGTQRFAYNWPYGKLSFAAIHKKISQLEVRFYRFTFLKLL